MTMEGDASPILREASYKSFYVVDIDSEGRVNFDTRNAPSTIYYRDSEMNSIHRKMFAKVS